MSEPQIERRKHPRVKRNLPLKLHKEDGDIITETKDISCSGAYCQIDKPLPLMSKVNITLLLPVAWRGKPRTKKIKCQGVIVRIEPVIVKEGNVTTYNAAIFFTKLSNPDKQKIAQYVNLQLSHNNL